MIFLYDGTFEGFLSAVFDAFLCKEEVEIEKKCEWQPQFFTETVKVETVPEKAERVADKLLSVCGRRGFSAVVYIFLSEVDKCETYDFYLIKTLFKRGTKAFSYFQDEKIVQAMNIRKKVARELDKLLGLLRFTELSLEQIAVECGLGTGYYFSRVFKSVEGMSPSEYRKKW